MGNKRHDKDLATVNDAVTDDVKDADDHHHQ